MSKIKGVLLVTTSIIWIIGGALVGLAGWLMVRDFEFKGLTGNQVVDIGFITTGGVVFLIGFIGCCGVVFEKIFLLKVYLGFMVLLLLAELVLSIFIAIKAEKVESFVTDNWNSIKDETRISVQEKLSCCGMKVLDHTHNSTRHPSCFDVNNVRRKNCYERLTDILKENVIVVASSVASLVLVEIIIIVSCWMFIKRLEEEKKLIRVHPMREVPMNGMPHHPQHHRRLAGGVMPTAPRNQDMHIEDYEYEDYEISYNRKPQIERGKWAKHNSRHFWGNK